MPPVPPRFPRISIFNKQFSIVGADILARFFEVKSQAEQKSVMKFNCRNLQSTFLINTLGSDFGFVNYSTTSFHMYQFSDLNKK